MTGVGLYGGYRGDEWFAERIKIFKQYTLKSLQAQTCQNFVIWISFRPQEERNPLTSELANYLKANDVSYVLTFDGLMYHDDKFSNGFKNKAKNMARIARDAFRNNRTIREVLPAFKEVYVNKNESLRTRLKKSLDVMKPHFGKSQWIAVSRIDSDDMFNKILVDTVQNFEPFLGALTCNKGLIYNTTTGELAEWNPPTNPPFHTIFFDSDTFFDVAKHLAFFKDFKSHEDIPKVFATAPLPEYMYCVTTHNPKNHISTTWNHPFRGRAVDPALLNNYL